MDGRLLTYERFASNRKPSWRASDAACGFARPKSGRATPEPWRANRMVLRFLIFENREAVAQAFLFINMDSLSASCLFHGKGRELK
jgi:hypothetical protein